MGAPPATRAGRHRDLVLEPAAESLAPGGGRAAAGQYLYDLAHSPRGRPELAEEPHLVRDGRGDALAQTCWRGARQRSGCEGQKKLIEQAYTLGAQLGLLVWCEDEAGPFQAVPHPGVSWQPRGRPASQPHEYVRGGTTKILTLFHPATGQVRLQPAARCTNAVLHPWLCEHGIMPLYTPLGGSWLNMAESIERVLKRRALDGQHPHSPEEIGGWFEQTARCWNEQPTPFVWNGKRRQRRRRSGGEPIYWLGGSGACTHTPLRRNRPKGASE